MQDSSLEFELVDAINLLHAFQSAARMCQVEHRTCSAGAAKFLVVMRAKSSNGKPIVTQESRQQVKPTSARYASKGPGSARSFSVRLRSAQAPDVKLGETNGSPTPSSPSRSSAHRCRPSSATAARKEQGELECLELVLKRMSLPKQDMVAAYLRRSRFQDSNQQQDKVFAFDGPDEHIRQALLQRNPGWFENKVPNSSLWDLKWSVSDCDGDYRDVQEGTLYNHFQNNRELTTKVGLANNLRRLAVDEQVLIDTFFPRCYDMSSTSEREDFVVDYRRCAALNVLKQHFRLCRRAPQGYHCNADVIRIAVRALQSWLEDLDGSYLAEEQGAPKPIQVEEWDALVLYSEVSDALLLREEDEDGPRRERNRGYTASGGAMHVREGSPRRPKFSHRSSDVRTWPELTDHTWLLALPPSLQKAAAEAVASLEVCWPQIVTHGPMNVWVVKPGTSSKGSGVFCLQSLPEVLHHCKTVTNRIVQKYVERPLLLFSGRKFDIRQWVLVRSFQPLKAFMFSSCYLRLCNEPYDLGDLANRQRHISNWAINRHGKHVSEGAVATLEELKEVLQMITHSNSVWEDQIAPGIREAICSCLYSVRHRVVQRSASFELYGFDFLIGEDLKPWLLEVNLSPACEARTPWIAAMLERMASRLLEVVIDGKFEPDGLEPDWICIADETESQSFAGTGLLGATAGQAVFEHAWPEDSSPQPATEALAQTLCFGISAPSEIYVQGSKLNLRTERRFEEAWRRQAALALISRVARGFLVRCRVRNHKREAAAIRLQRPARVWLACRVLKRLRVSFAVKEVQRYVRRFEAFMTLRNSFLGSQATTIQQCWRGHLGRQYAGMKCRSIASLVIQRHWRGKIVRWRLAACSRIVGWWRRLHQRRSAMAIRMQAAFRTFHAAQHLAFLKLHVQRPATFVSLFIGIARWKRRTLCLRAEAAAVTVQRYARGLLSCRRVAMRRLLKQLLQEWHRTSSRAAAAALILQCVRRGQLARMRASLLRLACRVVQVLCRTHAARQFLLLCKCEAATIRLQAFFRRVLCVKLCTKLRKTAVRLQAAWRGVLARRAAQERRRFVERRRKWLAASAAAMAEAAATAERELAASAATRERVEDVAPSIIEPNYLHEELSPRIETKPLTRSPVITRFSTCCRTTFSGDKPDTISSHVAGFLQAMLPLQEDCQNLARQSRSPWLPSWSQLLEDGSKDPGHAQGDDGSDERRHISVPAAGSSTHFVAINGSWVQSPPPFNSYTSTEEQVERQLSPPSAAVAALQGLKSALRLSTTELCEAANSAARAAKIAAEACKGARGLFDFETDSSIEAPRVLEQTSIYGGSALRAARQLRSSTSVTILISGQCAGSSTGCEGNHGPRSPRTTSAPSRGGRPPRQTQPPPLRRSRDSPAQEASCWLRLSDTGPSRLMQSHIPSWSAESEASLGSDKRQISHDSEHLRRKGSTANDPKGSAPVRPRSAIARLPSGGERLLLSAFLSAQPGIAATNMARIRPRSAQRS